MSVCAAALPLFLSPHIPTDFRRRCRRRDRLRAPSGTTVETYGAREGEGERVVMTEQQRRTAADTRARAHTRAIRKCRSGYEKFEGEEEGW